MSRPTFYGVVKPDGTLVLSSLAPTPELALRRMSHWIRNRWAEARKRGYTIRQVKIGEGGSHA